MKLKSRNQKKTQNLMRGQSKVKFRKSKIMGVLLWRSTATLKKMGRNRMSCQFKAKWLYFQIHKRLIQNIESSLL